MKKLPQRVLLSLAFLFASMPEIQANDFTENFRRIWQRCQNESREEIGHEEGLIAEYDLYFRFLEDRCRRLEELWKNNAQIDIVPCGTRDVLTPVPHCVVNPVIIKNGSVITFRIAWFLDYFGQAPRPQDTTGSAFWEKIIRPLLITPPPLSFSLVSPLSVTPTSPPPLGPLSDAALIPTLEKIFLTNRSRMLPSVVLLHELTHLLLRMDFILAKSLPITFCKNRQFEQDFMKWIVEEVLCKIHPKFRGSLSRPSATTGWELFPLSYGRSQPTATAADFQIVNLYQDCWGARDEILVIIGVEALA
jgi:hypothetical protein